MTALNPTDLPLSNGKGTPGSPCLQSKASLVHAHIHGYLTPEMVDVVFTDKPCWQNEVINRFGIHVNDAIPGDDKDMFARLDAMMPRVVAATVRGDAEVERRVNVRLLCSLAREVLHLVRDEDRDVCLRAIETRELWLLGETSEQECTNAAAGAARAAGAASAASAAEAARAAGAASAASAASAAWAAGAAGAASAAWTAWAAGAAGAALDLFDRLLDQWAKACAEEGAVVDEGWIDALKETGIVKDTEALA